MKSELAAEFSFENSRHASDSMTLSACARRSFTSTKPTVVAGSSRSSRGFSAFVGRANSTAAATPTSTSTAAANRMKLLLFSLSTMNLRMMNRCRSRNLSSHFLPREDVLRREVEAGRDEQHGDDRQELEPAVELQVDAAVAVGLARGAADDPVDQLAAEV